MAIRLNPFILALAFFAAGAVHAEVGIGRGGIQSGGSSFRGGIGYTFRGIGGSGGINTIRGRTTLVPLGMWRGGINQNPRSMYQIRPTSRGIAQRSQGSNLRNWMSRGIEGTRATTPSNNQGIGYGSINTRPYRFYYRGVDSRGVNTAIIIPPR